MASNNGKIPLPEDQEGAILAKTIEHAIRFSAIANAGGVIAVMTAYNATAKAGHLLDALAWPLGFFAAGVASALITTAGMVFIVGDIHRKPPDQPWPGIWRRIVPPLKVATDFAAVAMILFFMLGCLSGVTIAVIVG